MMVVAVEACLVVAVDDGFFSRGMSHGDLHARAS
jgi:hypothetical protein